MPCEKPLLSIIVPVYDVENYLQKCIDSILAQTFTDFELILVDDGSPDNCPALCDAAAAKDARIRVLHQKNGGLSAARNAGLDVARGEWIGFVDSDDYIAPEMYETLYKAVQSTGADLALCDYVKVDETGALCTQTHVAVPQKSLTGRELLQKAYWTTVQIACNKLYHRTIFAQLRYPVGKLNEDFFVIPEICLNTQKAVVVPDVLYYYVQRGDSIMGKSRTLRHYDAAEAAQHYWNCLVENRVYETLPAAAECTFCVVSRIYWTLPAALRKEPRSMEMLRMQSETVRRTRQYCAVPLKLQLQSWLLWRCPQVYGWLRDRSK
ncbi:MAG: glycosyltransferase [Faecalibacterium sp.]|nr:glycosyltransferase [Faecalibacterium sp.]